MDGAYSHWKLFLPALLFLFMGFMLFSPGCASISGNTANQITPLPNSSIASSVQTGNGSIYHNSTIENSTGNAANVSNVCETKYLKACPDGTNSYQVTCNDGYLKITSCMPNPYGRNITGIPSSLMYFTGFQCYWNLRDAYPYGSIFDPFIICKSEMIGWEQSCSCSMQIEDYVRKWGFPN